MISIAFHCLLLSCPHIKPLTTPKFFFELCSYNGNKQILELSQYNTYVRTVGQNLDQRAVCIIHVNSEEHINFNSFKSPTPARF